MVYIGGLVAFTLLMVHLFCSIGCKSFLKCTILSCYTYFIKNKEFSSIDYSIEGIGLRASEGVNLMICIVILFYHVWQNTYIFLCIIRCKVLPHYILHHSVSPFHNARFLFVLCIVERRIINCQYSL